MTSTGVTLSARAQRMADCLATWPRRRVQLGELWDLLDQIDPSSRMDVRRRRVLSELITELATVKAAQLPAARSYDRSEIPALPSFLTLPRDSPATEPRKPVNLSSQMRHQAACVVCGGWSSWRLVAGGSFIHAWARIWRGRGRRWNRSGMGSAGDVSGCVAGFDGDPGS